MEMVKLEIEYTFERIECSSGNKSHLQPNALCWNWITAIIIKTNKQWVMPGAKRSAISFVFILFVKVECFEMSREKKWRLLQKRFNYRESHIIWQHGLYACIVSENLAEAKNSADCAAFFIYWLQFSYY